MAHAARRLVRAGRAMTMRTVNEQRHRLQAVTRDPFLDGLGDSRGASSTEAATRPEAAHDIAAERVHALASPGSESRRLPELGAGEPRLDRTMRAALAGDQRAWDALVHQLTPMLRRVAKDFRLAPHDVDDVVQACWLALLEGHRSLREPAAVGAWMTTAARRQSLRARQRETREVLTDDSLCEDSAAPDCTEQMVLQAERVRILHEAVERLAPRQRTLLQSLIAAPNRSYADMSSALAIPIGSIGPTRERAIARLRRDEQLARVVAS